MAAGALLQPMVAAACKTSITRELPYPVRLSYVLQLVTSQIGFIEWDGHYLIDPKL
jgi:hypothetical protein